MAFEVFVSKLKASLAKVLGRQPSAQLSAADQKFAAEFLAGVTAQVLHEKDMIAARGKEPISMRLVPQVPVGDRDGAEAWIGGGARLPPGMAWPQIDGSALQLLAQIDCTKLPPELWSGLGPRSGWLAIFIDPRSVKAKVLHFAEAGAFQPPPPVLDDCNIVGYDGHKRAEASQCTWAFSRWPVDIVRVVDGAKDPRRDGRSKIRHERHDQRHDIVDAHRVPFDWSTAQTMINAALATYEAAMPDGTTMPDWLSPDTLARNQQAIIDAEQASTDADKILDMRLNLDEARAMIAVREFAKFNCARIVERMRALKARVDAMAASQPFSAAALAPILGEMKSMTWMHTSVPPAYRDYKKQSAGERFKEGVKAFVLPLTTHDPDARQSWAFDFETRLLDAAKTVYLSSPAALPAALVADCEEVWSNQAAHEMGGMGHVPWGYVHEFDDGEDVTLLELPSSDLIGWQFGDVYNLVVTMKKADLSRNNFSRPLVQITN